jgi:hypothetical protein
VVSANAGTWRSITDSGATAPPSRVAAAALPTPPPERVISRVSSWTKPA